jgi:hypothetical protein
MLEIPPLSPAYPVIKPGKIKKDDNFSEPPKRKKNSHWKSKRLYLHNISMRLYDD